MDGMLSQDEINALLNGMSSGDDGATAESAPAASADIDESLLSPTERDAVGEVANISMGSSATTLYSLVNRKVNITTPIVTLANWETVMKDYERPCVFIQIRYTQGLDGSNILILKERDVKIITDLMMGGDGTNIDGELGELHLSAISEAMNQMMGSAATSLSSMLGIKIDISPPNAVLVDMEGNKPEEIAEYLEGPFAKIAFRMQIADLVDSTILQLYPLDFAKSLYETFIGSMGVQEEALAPAPEPVAAEPATPQPTAPEPYIPPQAEPQGYAQPAEYAPQQNMGMPAGYEQMPAMPPQGYPQPAPGYGQMPPGYGQMPQGYGQMPPMQGMNIQPAQFQNFSGTGGAAQAPENIGLIMDVPLEVTVELGRTTKSISEILDFAPGTIIELDKIAGEPIDVLVNGKFVAKGEVVVIEESFGVRVTEIIK